MEKTALISLSGGLDSTTLLAYLLNQNYKIECVGFYYGSKHNKYEIEAAKNVAKYYGVKYELIKLDEFMSHFQSNLLKTGGDIPEGHYSEESMKLTVVPARNIIFISILSGFAWSRNIKHVALGVHASDRHIYPDCRKPFIEAMEKAVELGTDGNVKLLAPFIDMEKWDIVKVGTELKAPYELTRSCYKDQPVACGKCGTCTERKEAFQRNGLVDPIQYED
jgi:7-cyano-7-deazaguanine synthase